MVRRTYLDPDWIEEPTSGGRMDLYDGEIRHNDEVLRGFFDELEGRGLIDKSVIVLLSDHGEYLGEGGNWNHHPPGYPEVVRVPLIWMHDGRVPEGMRVKTTVQLIDVMPTLLELAGIKISELALQGDSLLDLMKGSRLLYYENRLAVSEEPNGMSPGAPCGCGSLFFRRWQLIGPSRSRLPAALRPRVFELGTQFGYERLENVFAPDLYVKHLHRRTMDELQATNLATWERLTGGSSEMLRLDPVVEERLQALGYID